MNNEISNHFNAMSELVKKLTGKTKDGLIWRIIRNEGNPKQPSFEIEAPPGMIAGFENGGTFVLENWSTETRENYGLFLKTENSKILLLHNMTPIGSDEPNELSPLYEAVAENNRFANNVVRRAHFGGLIKKAVRIKHKAESDAKPIPEGPDGNILRLRDLLLEAGFEKVLDLYLSTLSRVNSQMFDDETFDRAPWEELARAVLTVLTECPRQQVNDSLCFDFSYAGLHRDFRLTSPIDGTTLNEYLSQDIGRSLSLTHSPLHILSNTNCRVNKPPDEYRDALATLVFANIMRRFL